MILYVRACLYHTTVCFSGYAPLSLNLITEGKYETCVTFRNCFAEYTPFLLIVANKKIKNFLQCFSVQLTVKTTQFLSNWTVFFYGDTWIVQQEDEEEKKEKKTSVSEKNLSPADRIGKYQVTLLEIYNKMTATVCNKVRETCMESRPQSEWSLHGARRGLTSGYHRFVALPGNPQFTLEC